MDRERAWTYFIDGLTVCWVTLFCVSLAIDVGALSLSSARAAAIDRFLRITVFDVLADVCVVYWHSEKAPVAFVRSN